MLNVWGRTTFGEPIALSDEIADMHDVPYSLFLNKDRFTVGDVFLENIYSLGMTLPSRDHFETYFVRSGLTDEQKDYIRSCDFYDNDQPEFDKRDDPTYDSVSTEDIVMATLAIGKGIWKPGVDKGNRIHNIADMHLWDYQDGDSLTKLRFSMSFGDPRAMSLAVRFEDRSITVGELAYAARRYPKFLRNSRSEVRNYFGENLVQMARNTFGESWVAWLIAALKGSNTMIAPWVTSMRGFNYSFDEASDLLCRGIYEPDLLAIGIAEDIDAELLVAMRKAA